MLYMGVALHTKMHSIFLCLKKILNVVWHTINILAHVLKIPIYYQKHIETDFFLECKSLHVVLKHTFLKCSVNIVICSEGFPNVIIYKKS